MGMYRVLGFEFPTDGVLLGGPLKRIIVFWATVGPPYLWKQPFVVWETGKCAVLGYMEPSKILILSTWSGDVPNASQRVLYGVRAMVVACCFDAASILQGFKVSGIRRCLSTAFSHHDGG